MKFKYNGKEHISNMFGYDFSNGQTPEITEPFIINKLQNNRFFEVVQNDDRTICNKSVIEDRSVQPVNIGRGRPRKRK